MSSTDNALNTRFRFNLTGQRPLSLRLQKVPMSPITLGGTMMAPHMGKADFNIPSNKLTYDPITFDYLVSEDYGEYLDILDWMEVALSFDDFTESEERGELELLDSNFRPVARFTYLDIWPTEVGELTYETDVDQAIFLKGTVTCFFSDIRRERLV